jgi:hypothetical protein
MQLKSKYPAMNIIILRLFIEFPRRVLAMNHSSSHGNSFLKNPFQHLKSARLSHSIDATFGESQVDRFCEIQGSGRRIPEIYYSGLEQAIDNRPNADESEMKA